MPEYHGALNLKALTSPLICEYKTINEYNVSRFSMRYERFILIITRKSTLFWMEQVTTVHS